MRAEPRAKRCTSNFVFLLNLYVHEVGTYHNAEFHVLTTSFWFRNQTQQGQAHGWASSLQPDLDKETLGISVPTDQLPDVPASEPAHDKPNAINGHISRLRWDPITSCLTSGSSWKHPSRCWWWWKCWPSPVPPCCLLDIVMPSGGWSADNRTSADFATLSPILSAAYIHWGGIRDLPTDISDIYYVELLIRSCFPSPDSIKGLWVSMVSISNTFRGLGELSIFTS